MAPRCSQLSVACALLAVLAVVGILLVVAPAKKREMPPEYMYGIVLDAGSSHTSMFIYKWPADKQNGTGIVTQHHECPAPKPKGTAAVTEGSKCLDNDKGISMDEPDDAAKSLKCCLDEAMTVVPKFRHRQTPIYLGATAGMRLLNITSPTKSQQILKKVESKIRSYPFDFKKAVILSGQEEGAYGWVTVNYLIENFAKYGFVGRWLNPGRKTIGALDLGGASTQITFETDKQLKSKSDAMELKLYGQTYRLYTHSFLCYGKNEFLRRLLAHLIKTQGTDAEVSHPCYPQNFSMTITPKTDVFDSACTEKDSQSKSDAKMSVVGTGDYENCLKNVTDLFPFDKCSHPNCSFDGVFQPSVEGNFMAFSAFYYTYNYISQLTNFSITSPEQMKKAIKLICGMTIPEMTKKTKVSEAHMRDLCASSNYIYVLLMKGYHFDNASFPSISFQKKAGGASVGWALGYMLILSNMVPAERLEVMTLPLWPWACILCLFIALLLMALGGLLNACRNRGSKEDLV